jgi:hypothetical protein
MPLQICILETDVLRPELVDQYDSYGRMFEQLFARQPIAAEFKVYNVMEGHYPPDSEHYDAYLGRAARQIPLAPMPGFRP